MSAREILGTFLLALAGCGSANTLPTIPKDHRATVTACMPVAGTLPCMFDNDCHQYSLTATCDQGFCNLDKCTSDSQCGGLDVCACRGDQRGGGVERGFRVCLPSNCRVDADCGPAGYCSPSLSSCGSSYGLSGYFCHTHDDECTNDNQCVKDSVEGYCAYDRTLSHWACGYITCQ
jgi:hypothetical protein